MDFEITHITNYTYGQPAAEAYGEARLTPPNLPNQKVLSHELLLEPPVETSSYVDFHGNLVHFFSLPFRHSQLKITNHALVRTSTVTPLAESMELTVQETRQIFTSILPDIFEYLQPTPVVSIGPESLQWSKKFLRGNTPLGKGIFDVIHAINTEFVYTKGATENSTPLFEIWKNRKGVCQDFAHVALSVFRTAGLPSRYVCGYIETDPPPRKKGVRALIGAVATHAWVEVLLPGMKWVAIDPTNNQWCNERYVAVSFGRDFRDATPLRGTFKGSGRQELDVQVIMKRRPPPCAS